MSPFVVRSSTIPVADLAVPLEYKTARKDARENRKQLLVTTTFCMNGDPRRKHIYGITIEDDTMAVWYFSRSHSAKSPDFKFTEDCRTYLRVILSLMFATGEELGFDPTIQRRLDPEMNKLCFVYEVDGHYYKTQKAIFDYGSLCTTGRATRVWEVIEVVSFDELQLLEGSQKVILRDAWLDAEWMTEGDIQREIFGDLDKIADNLGKGAEPEGFKGMDEDSKQILRECLVARIWCRYFLTLVHERKGTVTKEVAEAAEPDSTLFGAPPTTIGTWWFPFADPHKDKPFNRQHPPKRQYRVVFEEVCVVLHDVPKLGDVVTAMLSCVFALQLMFLAGWVHRDISSGNLYCFKDINGEVRGILADLEYAKRFCPSNGHSSSDPKMGTAFFMAVEIQDQSHLYIPSESPEDIPNLYDSGYKTPLVVHNFEHDMESIFWLLLWTLLSRFPSTLESNERSEFGRIFCEIFQDTSICSMKRRKTFYGCGLLLELLQRFLAPQLRSLLPSLEILRIALVAGYIRREYKFDNLSSYSWLYQYLRRPLVDLQQLTLTGSFPDLHCSGRTSPPPLQVNKRRRTPSQDDDDGEYRPSKMSRGGEHGSVFIAGPS